MALFEPQRLGLISSLRLGSWARAFAVLACLLGFAWGQVPPYKRASEQDKAYQGPLVQMVNLQGKQSFQVLYFGPQDFAHPLGAMAWRGISRALDELTKKAAKENLALHIDSVWSDQPWGSGIAQLTKHIYTQGASALLGSLDGDTTHLLEQIATKTRLLHVDCFSSDPTVNQAGVGWVFSYLPSNKSYAAALAGGLRKTNLAHSLFVVSTQHDARMFYKDLRQALLHSQMPPQHVIELHADRRDFTVMNKKLTEIKAQGLVMIADALTSLAWAKFLAEKHPSLSLWGSHSLGQAAFYLNAPQTKQATVFPHVAYASEQLAKWQEDFRNQYQVEADYTAVAAYDCVQLLYEAALRSRTEGLNILDGVQKLSPWQGLGGQVLWDSEGRNHLPVELVGLVNGRMVGANEP